MNKIINLDFFVKHSTEFIIGLLIIFNIVALMNIKSKTQILNTNIYYYILNLATYATYIFVSSDSCIFLTSVYCFYMKSIYHYISRILHQ